MPNSLDSTGLITATQAELVTNFTASFQTIYGSDINLDPDSPDGQAMMIFIQAMLDVEDLIAQVYNSMDPDKALGVTLDARVAYNGIQRKTGTQFNTFSTTNVTVVTFESVTLYGLDQNLNPVYTVADDSGTQWQLKSTQTAASAGSFVYLFQAVNPGSVLSQVNTIVNQVTPVVGVSSVNNPDTTGVTIGTNEESDAALKIRRQKSVAIGSQGYLAAMYAALNNVEGVTSVFIYENLTGSPIESGLLSGMLTSAIWVIVSGSATNADIANAIYIKRGTGAPMTGDVTHSITQVDGTNFIVRWDVVTPEEIFIKFTATSLDGINLPKISNILSNLPTLFVPGVAAEVNFNDIATFTREIDSNCLVTNAGFSSTAGGSYTNTFSPTSAKQQIKFISAKIIILPIILSPFNPLSGTTVKVANGGSTQQFTPLGGYGPYTYSMQSGNGSINSSGLYTSSSAGTDVAKVIDSLGNQATATITVT